MVAALSLAACGQSAAPCGTTSDADQLAIVAAAYPFQFVAELVVGRYGSVTSLTEPGAEPHDEHCWPRPRPRPAAAPGSGRP